MAKELKTTIKRPKKPFTGKEGVRFSKDNQPTSEAKKAGIAEWKKQMNLTKALIATVTDIKNPELSLKKYAEALIKNAILGNSASIAAVNKSLEDEQPIQFDITSNGNTIFWGGKEIKV